MLARSRPSCWTPGCAEQSLPDMVRGLGEAPALSDLRKLGESVAARFPGYVDMGMSPVKQVCAWGGLQGPSHGVRTCGA